MTAAEDSICSQKSKTCFEKQHSVARLLSTLHFSLDCQKWGTLVRNNLSALSLSQFKGFAENISQYPTSHLQHSTFPYNSLFNTTSSNCFATLLLAPLQSTCISLCVSKLGDRIRFHVTHVWFVTYTCPPRNTEGSKKLISTTWLTFSEDHITYDLVTLRLHFTCLQITTQFTGYPQKPGINTTSIRL